MMKSVEKAEKVINSIREMTEKQNALIADELKKINAKIEENEAAAQKAEESLDAVTYAKVNNELASLRLQKKMFEDRLKVVNSPDVISESEYKELTSDIMKEFADELAAAEKELFDLSNKMKAVADRIGSDREAANKALHTLQVEIYQCKDCRRENGVIWQADIKEFKIPEAEYWARAGYQMPQYSEYKGKHR